MMDGQEFKELYSSLALELRRGSLILAVLSLLKEQKYGYALNTSLAERGLEFDHGTLYPLLRRLESQGLLESSWDVDGARPRRYYVISPVGRQALENLTADWHSLIRQVENILDESASSS